MQIKHIITLSVIAFLAFTIMIGYDQSNFGSQEMNVLRTFTHSTSSFAISGKNTVLDFNSGRQYALIQNTDGTNFVYLTFSDTTSTEAGYQLAAGATFTIDKDNMYLGKVTAIADTAPVVLEITEAK